ncbi:MAG: PilN domain-containing protein [Acidobacteriota bacterium]
MKRLWMNFAEAPFVNRALPLSLMLLVSGTAILLTLFNAVTFVLVGSEFRTERKTLEAQKKRLEALESEEAEKKRLLGGGNVAALAGEARFLEQVLSAKRFDWPRLLKDLERVKPYGVMLESVAPRTGKGGLVTIQLRGVANPRAELLKLEENLFADPRFQSVKLEGEQKESGSPWTRFTLSCTYLPEAGREP